MLANEQLRQQGFHWWLLAKRILLFLLSETVLRCHLCIYWLICMFTMMDNKDGLHSLRIVLVAMCIVFALLAMVTDTACFFYPFLLVVQGFLANGERICELRIKLAVAIERSVESSQIGFRAEIIRGELASYVQKSTDRAIRTLASSVFDLVKSLTVFSLLTLKLSSPEGYSALLRERGLENLESFTKTTLEEDQLICLWFGLCSLYFTMLIITIIKNIADYHMRERQLQNNQFVFPGAVQHPNVVVLTAEPELGNTNPDDPPPYSTIASEREENSGETAKEETLPPRYSELDRSTSSHTLENGSKQPRRLSSDVLKKTVVIQKR